MGQTAFLGLVHEIAAEMAAPHQNEGPHRAAGLRARSSADRSGARGKRKCRQSRGHEEKRQTGSRAVAAPAWSAPFPGDAIVGGEEAPPPPAPSARSTPDSR